MRPIPRERRQYAAICRASWRSLEPPTSPPSVSLESSSCPTLRCRECHSQERRSGIWLPLSCHSSRETELTLALAATMQHPVHPYMPMPASVAGSLADSGNSVIVASVSSRTLADRDRILERDADDLGRIDDAGLDQIDVLVGGRVEAEIALCLRACARPPRRRRPPSSRRSAAPVRRAPASGSAARSARRPRAAPPRGRPHRCSAAAPARRPARCLRQPRPWSR